MSELDEFIISLFGPDSRLARQIPLYESRPAQMRMARLVAQVVADERFLMVEAGTGTGKTLAYLLPLLALGETVVVSTATRALQDQIVEKDLPLLRRVVPIPFRSAVLKGRGNYLCVARLRLMADQEPSLAPRERPLWQQVTDWARTTLTGDRDELTDLPESLPFWPFISAGGDHCTGQKCAAFRECHLFHARERARKADLVVVNHHLFFADLAVREGGFGEILPKYEVVVFDEAHRIPDVATQFFGLEISNYRLRDLVRDLRTEFDAVGADDLVLLGVLKDLDEVAARLRGSFPPEDRRSGLAAADMEQAPGRMLLQVEQELHRLINALEPHAPRSAGLAAGLRRAEELIGIASRLRTLDDPRQVYWYETRGRGIFLQASPLEVGPLLADTLYPRLRSAIFTSATLATGQGRGAFRYLGLQLGLPSEDTLVAQMPTPFDYGNRALLYLPDSLPEPDAPDFTTRAVEEIAALLTASSGRAFCLFTSRRVLEGVLAGLRGRIPFPLLVQGEAPKRALLESFQEVPGAVLLGMSSFWEGVDVPGEALSMVIIDRLPFPSPGDPLVAARGRYLESRGGNSFRDLSLPRAILTLKQGLGRLLRRRDDRGIMAILDVRLSRRSYGQQVRSGLPPAPVVRDLAAVTGFFS
ncbi:MAG: ATP-dependent DNA helicase [Magnetococcales bacterium]|nr:ATP-dependent DNA helicase [Magnetococcales bacterium]